MKKLKFIFVMGLLICPALFSAIEVKALRVKQGPKVDGHLSDPVWQEALPFSDFRMFEPQPNGEPTERTELRIVYDDANLYIGVRCLDKEPRRIASNTLANDTGGGQSGMGFMHVPTGSSDDVVRILLDPFQDKRTAYLFFISPRGARGEGLISGGESSLNEDGWSAEIRVPFKTISFKPGLSAWGINVERVIARKQETIRLSGTNRDSKFNNPMEA